jgi:hypothetical protein
MEVYVSARKFVCRDSRGSASTGCPCSAGFGRGQRDPRRTEGRQRDSCRGTGADADATISIDSVAMGAADGNGDFEIREGGFSSATCVIVVSDGSTSESVLLSGCTPSSQPPPSNQPLVANAGTDQTQVDTDANGSEPATRDGLGSSDPDRSISSYIHPAAIGDAVDRRPRHRLASHPGIWVTG